MLLERALHLVQGVAWRIVPRGTSEWAYQRQLPYAIRDAVTDAAIMLARVSLDHTNEPRVAMRAARAQALSTGGHSNMELCELALRAALQAGDLGEAARCEEAITAAQNEFGYEPSQMGLELLVACRRMESQRHGGGVLCAVCAASVSPSGPAATGCSREVDGSRPVERTRPAASRAR